MRNDNQGYKRTPAQLKNIATRKQGGAFGQFRVQEKPAPPSYSWWAETKNDAEFKTAHTAQLPRMTAIRVVYRFKDDEF